MSTEFYRCDLCQMASEDESRFTSMKVMGAPFTEQMLPTHNGVTNLVYCDQHESHDDENTCCLCFKPLPDNIRYDRNNPHPIVSTRLYCCDECNRSWVIPARWHDQLNRART